MIEYLLFLLPLLSACDHLNNSSVYEGESFCVIGDNVSGSSNSDKSMDFSIHHIELNGIEVAIYEGNGVGDLRNYKELVATNGWHWIYSSDESTVYLQHKNVEGWPRRVEARYRLNEQDKLPTKELADSFVGRDKNGKCDRNSFVNEVFKAR